MSEVLFETGLGYSVYDDETGDVTLEIYAVDGVPGDASLDVTQLARSNASPKGAWVMNTTNGVWSRKKTTGSGADKWVAHVDTDDLNIAQSSDSWREPVARLVDYGYPSLAAAHTDLNSHHVNFLQGGANPDIGNGARILLTNTTGANKNVFIVTGSPGSGATLVEDPNAATARDVLYVDGGTHAGKRFNYNETPDQWVQSSQTTLDELGFIREFIGKTGGGSENPGYSSVNYIDSADAVKVAVGKLDGQLKLESDRINVLITEDDFIKNFIGKGGGGAETPQYSSTNVVANNISLEAAIGALDEEVGGLSFRTSTVLSTSYIFVDSVATKESKMVRWIVYLQDGFKVQCYTIDAIHNGTDSVDAGAVDHTKYATLRLSSPHTGLEITVDLNGSGVGQYMRLAIKASSTVTATTTRSVLA